MKPRTKVLLLAAIIIAGLAFFCLWNSEPSYQGKSLSEWLGQEPVPSCCGEEMKLSEETKEALRIMGPNIVPYLVKKVGRKESGFRKSLVDFCSKHNLPSFIKDNSDRKSTRLNSSHG